MIRFKDLRGQEKSMKIKMSRNNDDFRANYKRITHGLEILTST